MKISVIIPVYNAEKYVTKAVESALQFDEVYEVILVEDKSPDNALEICQKLAEKYNRVKLFQHPDKGNHGAGATRNLGLEKATGDFIAFLDADDYYLPNRFDAEKKLFLNPEVEGVYGALGVHYYSEMSKEQYFHIYGERLTTVYKKHAPEDVFAGQLGLRGSFGLFTLDTLTLRRKPLLEKVKSLFKTHLRLHQDTEFLFRVSFYMHLYPGILDAAVGMRGVHESNRITSVESGKVAAHITKIPFWKEVKNWAENEPLLQSSERTHINRILRSYEIAAAAPAKKWMMILWGLLTDFKGIRSGLYNINFRKNLFW